MSLYLQDQLTLLADRRFNYLEGQIVRNATNTGWRYMIEVAAYFTPPAATDSMALLAGLHDNRPEARITPQTYRDFAFRIDPIVEFQGHRPMDHIASLGRPLYSGFQNRGFHQQSSRYADA